MPKCQFLVAAAALFVTLELGATAQEETGDQVYRLVGSYYDTRDYDATLMLNNKGPEPIDQLITVFSPDGQAEMLDPITVEGASFTVISLNELVSDLPRSFRTGSLEVVYQGQFLEMGAQVRLSNGTTLVEEQLIRPEAEFASSRLDGVFLLPSRRASFKASVANTSDEAVRVRLTASGPSGESEVLALGLQPRASQIIDLRRLVSGSYGGLTIEHTGQPGDVAANAAINDESIEYSAIVGLSDCGKAGTNELHGGGLRLGHVNGESLRPAVLIRNLGADPTSVSVTIPITVSAEVYAAQVPTVFLAPGEARLLSEEISETIATYADISEIDSAGVEVRYSGAPGSVAAEATSVSASGNYAFRVPMIDQEGHFSASGGFPWDLTGGQNTVFYVKNLTQNPQMHHWYLDFEGGRYAGDASYLDPGQTLAVDIRSLRDAQIVDRKGRTIPENIGRGQIFWSKLNGGKKALVGRVEQFDPAGFATSYSCENCCPDEVIDFFSGTSNLLGNVGSQFQLDFFGLTNSCFGSEGEEFWIDPFDLVFSPPGFLSVSSSGLATATGSGSGSLQVEYDFTNFEFEEGNGEEGGGGSDLCVELAVIFALVIEALIEEPVTVTITGPSSVTVGATLTDVLEISKNPPSGGTLSNWRVVDGDSSCVELTGTSAEVRVRGLAPGTVKLKVDYTHSGQTTESNEFQLSINSTPQYLRLRYTTGADDILGNRFGPTGRDEVKDLVEERLQQLFDGTGANVQIADPPAGIRSTLLEVRGDSPQNQQGGEGGFDLMNRDRAGFVWIFIGEGSIDILSNQNPTPGQPNPRTIKSNVANALVHLAAHEYGHALGLVPRQSELESDGLAAKLAVTALNLNGNQSHHNNSPNNNFVMIQTVNFTEGSGWDSQIVFADNENQYLVAILP